MPLWSNILCPDKEGLSGKPVKFLDGILSGFCPVNSHHYLCSMQNFKIPLECSNAKQIRIALKLLTPVHKLSEWNMSVFACCHRPARHIQSTTKGPFLSRVNSLPGCGITQLRKNIYTVVLYTSHGQWIQRWAKRWALGCEIFLPGPAWLLLSKSGPPFSLSLYVDNDHHSRPVTKPRPPRLAMQQL